MKKCVTEERQLRLTMWTVSSVQPLSPLIGENNRCKMIKKGEESGKEERIE